ncbi:type II toxin-antitoxin system Phd/YefM family antitoxin [Ferrimicrobium sp.]|uniref:type II toxin-antitoxin system Phd/YefM family antitoxin n=1 Tax=Ferrimicrobium sp. TaxID=2926050 RepID=UPI00345C40AC
MNTRSTPSVGGSRESSLSNTRDRLSEIVEEVEQTDAEWIINRNGRPVAVIVSYSEHESLVETLNVLSDRSLMSTIDEAEREIASGEIEEFILES